MEKFSAEFIFNDGHLMWFVLWLPNGASQPTAVHITVNDERYPVHSQERRDVFSTRRPSFAAAKALIEKYRMQFELCREAVTHA